MQLSKNFSLVELTKSQTAERKGISNDPSPDHLENLRLLCERVLQPVRDHFNHVVSVSSGYRSPALVPSDRQQSGVSNTAKAWQLTSKSMERLTMKFLTGSRSEPHVRSNDIRILESRRTQLRMDPCRI